MTNDTLASLLPSAVILGTVMALAVFLTYSRPAPAKGASIQGLVVWTAACIGVQSVHFLEEFLLGFQQQFPALFGMPAMSAATFASVNLGFIGLWLLSLAGLVRGLRVALVPVWFLALAALGNGVAHPLLAFSGGGYFPGLVSAIPLALCGWKLLQQLRKTTINA